MGTYVEKKSPFFKELTPRSWIYELCGKGKKKKKKKKKKIDQNQDKHTPHTVLQKLSPKTTHVPLTPKRGGWDIYVPARNLRICQGEAFLNI